MSLSGNNLAVYKLVVVGDGGVGKSSLTIQFFQKTFVEHYDPTIEDSYMQHVEVDGVQCILDVLDTAGEESYSAMKEQYIRKGDGFLLVFSVTDKTSLRCVYQFYESILRVKNSDTFPMVIVGNKVDLVNLRVISKEQGEDISNKLKVPYIETSAKNPPINVDQAFHEIVRIIRCQQPSNTLKKKKTKLSCTCI